MASTAPTQRLYSLDALRGFDMFWIMGGEDIIHAIAKVTGSSFFEGWAHQLTHPAWHGFRFYDLIFPLFLFMAGVATPYSMEREFERGKTRQQILMKVIRRGLVLVLLGIIANNGLELKPISEMRFGSVLGRIGLAYMFANIIYLYTKERGQIIWFWALLFGYWALILVTAAPGFPAGDLTMEGNIMSFIDRTIMPGHLYLTIHDPEGVMSTIPAISTALLGIYAGRLLKNPSFTMTRKAGIIEVMGVSFLILGGLWNFVFPINKNLWTSSFTLWVGGWSLILLGIFYYIIDIKGHRKWAFFFSVIGMNSILIYLSGHFINWGYTTEACFKWLIQLSGESLAPLTASLCFVGIEWLFLYFMYRQRLFLRV
jgi:predicted acyltransferase